jgi:hypothetical protein
MTPEEIREHAERHIKSLVPILGLQDWTIKLDIEELEDEYGKVFILAENRSARISIHPTKHENLDELEDTVEHELCHLFDARINDVMRMVYYGMGANHKALPVIQEAFRLLGEYRVVDLQGLMKRMREVTSG